ASEKFRLKKWGPLKIQSYLYKKGILQETAQQAVENVFSDTKLDEVFLTLIAARKKRFLREEDPLKRKKKVFDYLARRGYQATDIYKYLDKLMQELNK